MENKIADEPKAVASITIQLFQEGHIDFDIKHVPSLTFPDLVLVGMLNSCEKLITREPQYSSVEEGQ